VVVVYHQRRGGEEEGLESSTGVLKELAAREQALSGKVVAAREEAINIVAAAEARAKELIAQAEAEAARMTAEYRSRRESEEKTILETTLAAARSAADGLRSAAEAKVPDAVKHIVSKVLP
jgi:vacuolar-type H+-ATPase subunit H